VISLIFVVTGYGQAVGFYLNLKFLKRRTLPMTGNTYSTRYLSHSNRTHDDARHVVESRRTQKELQESLAAGAKVVFRTDAEVV